MSELKTECVKSYFSDPLLSMCRLVERVVKPFVIDRKNFLFSKSTSGAEASAAMMTVIRTALRNGLIPERYLAWLFENSGRLPVARLMPWSEDVPDSCKVLAK